MITKKLRYIYLKTSCNRKKGLPTGFNDTLFYSSSHIPWRNSILFTEGVIEA